MPPRRETILVVDDEDDIRAVVRQMLTAEGYLVLDAEDPNQALRLASEQHVDLLLTDVVMPLMRGTELAQRLLAVVPSAKVLLMSAYRWPRSPPPASLPRQTLHAGGTPGEGPPAAAGRALAVRAAAATPAMIGR